MVLSNSAVAIDASVKTDQDQEKIRGTVLLDFEANEHQLKLYNDLVHGLKRSELTMDDIMKTVFPEEYNKLPIATKENIKHLYYDLIVSENLSDGDTRGMYFSSNLSQRGSSLNFTTTTTLGGPQPEIWTVSHLVDDNGPAGEYIAMRVTVTTNSNYGHASGYHQPPAGTYRTFGTHWIYVNLGGGLYEWRFYTSNSFPLNFPN